MKETNVLKRWIKNKVSFTQALLVAFLISGGISYAETVVNTTEITINKVEEATGLQLGTGSRARGIGSIATGKNAIAIGKNAVATGGNESKQTIEAKLLENSQKLAEIARKQKEVDDISRDLEALKNKEQETIQAGIRVRELAKAKENAKLEWEKLQKEHKSLVDSNASFFAENKAKIDDLNSRLAGVSQLTNVDISSEQGLIKAAQELKVIAEKGTTLNLTEGFYKDYVSSYYKALGHLTHNKNLVSKFSTINYNYIYFTNANVSSESIKNAYSNLDDVVNLGYGVQRGVGVNNALNFHDVNDPYYSPSAFSDNTQYIPSSAIYIHKMDTVTKTKPEYDKAIQELEVYRGAFKEYMGKTNDVFFTKEVRESFNVAIDQKIDYQKKVYEVAYYQGEYDRTKNTTWLDKKKVAMEEAKKIKERTIENPANVRRKIKEKWEKENITDVEEKNKITTEKLTKELEEKLGINKDAILAREREIEEKRKAMENAENTYRNMNPNERDLILAREYERVAQELNTKGEALKTATERLESLKETLTLHDLKNKGEDAIAFGTDNLASGNASVALGKANVATKENAIALGSTNLASGDNAIAIGHGNNALSNNAIAFGQQNSVNGEKSIAIGYGHKIVGKGSATLGDPNTIYGDNNFVIGNDNTVGIESSPKNNVFILGSNVDASTVENAIVLGNASTAVTGAVSVGSASSLRSIKFVAPGTEDTDAINKKQLTDAIAAIPSADLSNYYNKTETDNKLNAKLDKTSLVKGTLTSTDFSIVGDGKLLDSNLTLNLNDGAVSENKLQDALKTKINGKVDTTILNTYKTEVTNNLATKADKTTVYTKTETYNKTEVDNLISGKVTTTELNTTLDNYLKKDASNLDKDSKTAITSKLNEGANIESPTNTLVTDNDVKTHLEANYTNNAGLTTKLNTLKTEINTTTDFKITENNKNYYTKSEVEEKLTKVTVKTEADITSTTLDITNGKNRLIGTENLVIDIKDEAISESKISKELKTKIEDKYTKEEANTKFVDKTSFNTSLDKKANINGDNIVTKKDKEDFRNNIEVYSKNEVDTKLVDTLSGDITATEEKGVKGKVIHKHLKDNYVNKQDLQVRDEAIISNYQEIQANKAAIANNTRRIEQVDKKVNKTAALAQATANLDFGNVRIGKVVVGAGVGNYMSETGVAVGVAYRPTESVFMTAKWSGLAGEPRYNSYGASISYQVN